MTNLSKQEDRANRRRANKRNQQMRNMLWIGIGAVLVAVALILPNIDFTPPVIVDYEMTNGNLIGDPEAPVSVVEFADYQCPHCRDFHNENFPRLLEAYIYTGKVRFEYRSAGEFFPGSAQAAEANYCAGDQDAFYQFNDLLYENLSFNFTDARMLSDAEAIGLDRDVFKDCLDTDKYAERVANDLVDFRNAGGQGTPSFLVNDVLVTAGNDYEGLVAAIESVLP
jgi:protein-disulfide isomerase